MPATPAQPGCMRLVQAPSSRNSRLPLAIESTMPCAMVARSRIEAQKLRRRERAAERADQPGRMKADLMEAALGDRSQSALQLPSPRRRPPARFSPSASSRSASAKRTRKAARGRMNDAARMRVVEVKAVDEYPVHEHGIAQRQSAADADDGRCAGAQFLRARPAKQTQKDISSTRARCRRSRGSNAWRARERRRECAS